MDETLKQRLRTSYRTWTKTCDRCGHEAKALAFDVYKESVAKAVAYVNTLALPAEYGVLRVNEVSFAFDPATWSGGFATGVMHGDTFDGGPEMWYWRVPKKGPTEDGDVHWSKTPADALIDLVENMERLYGPKGLGPAPRAAAVESQRAKQRKPRATDGNKPTPWHWWLGDEDHWVAYPDKVLEVGDISDEHLRNILRYVARWTPDYVRALSFEWMVRSGYFSPAVNDLSDHAQDAVDAEVYAMSEMTDREWMCKLAPALPRLEAEAARRGFPVPAIPSYPDPAVGSCPENPA
jgi:hypothetical protein